MKAEALSRPQSPEVVPMAGQLRRINASMRSQPIWVVLLPLLVMALFVGWLDYVTGWELSLFIFYAIPILLAVWWAGARAGVTMALTCAFIWWMANEPAHPYKTQIGYTWAMVSRLFYFFMVVVAVAAVRRRQDADAARIQMLEEHHQLERDIVVVSDHEQQRIGQDLHDGLCQMLAAIGCAARILADDLKSRGLPEAEDADLIEENIQRTVLEARNLARGIFPVHVDRDGLSTALADLARITSRLTGVTIDFNEPADIGINNPKVAMNLYRIAQEAVSNAVRHGDANHITIRLAKDNRVLTLSIQDNGKGFSSSLNQTTKGMGLRVMRYRARCVMGDLHISTPPGGGVLVTCQMPLERCNNGDDARDQNSG
jgi:signal transduction histidine kinase